LTATSKKTKTKDNIYIFSLLYKEVYKELVIFDKKKSKRLIMKILAHETIKPGI